MTEQERNEAMIIEAMLVNLIRYGKVKSSEIEDPELREIVLKIEQWLEAKSAVLGMFE